MHAFILIGTDDPNKFPNRSDFPQLQSFSIKTIAEVRAITYAFRFPPRDKTLVHLHGVSEAKAEAQNALLKLLEEPPANTITFLLTADREEGILQTVLSRASVIKLKSERTQQSDDDFWSKSTDQKIELTASITDRDEAKKFLEKVSSSAKSAAEKESALSAYKAISQNGSIPLQLLNFVLGTLAH